MAHVMFGGLTHEPAVRLAERLAELAPDGLERVLLGRLRVGLGRGGDQDVPAVPARARTRGAHAAADGAGAATTATPPARWLCATRSPGCTACSRACSPSTSSPSARPTAFDAGLDEAWAQQVSELASAHAHELAAVIVEPVVQGAGGMRFHSPECVALLRRVCDEHGLLLVLDEIATGFGRTGAMFACEHAGVAPDVMCVGKALTGGYMTLAATLCTPAVADAVSGGAGGGLMHGPTFMANPLACAVALASLALLDEGCWRSQVDAIERGLRSGLAPARELPGVKDVRVLGAIGVVQLDREVDIGAATAVAVGSGVWLRPFRDLIYAMPPYVIDQQDLETVTAAMVDAARVGAGADRR